MKRSKKSIAIFLAMTVMLLCTALLPALAQESTTMNVTLRIEGVTGNVFYKTASIPYTNTLTLKDALLYFDTQDDTLTISGMDIGYVSAVNTESAGKFGGYDGWLYRVNGEEPSAGIETLLLKDNDSVVLFYGDPFGVGMQFPVADTREIDKGIIRFTSEDTTYDAEYNPTVTVNPVASMQVVWSYGNQTATYTTDKDGKITVNPAHLTVGEHKVQVSKTNDAGIPLVLRFAADYTITVTATPTQPSTTTSTPAKTPDTGADYTYLMAAVLVAAIAMIVVYRKGFQNVYEK